jgi:hypothetical protein
MSSITPSIGQADMFKTGIRSAPVVISAYIGPFIFPYHIAFKGKKTEREKHFLLDNKI